MTKIKQFFQRSRRHQSGSTLIEILVAMVLVATILTALASMMTMSMKVSESNEMEQLAQLKGQEALEYLRKERLVRGWGTFYSSLADNTNYCLSVLPANITEMSTLIGACPEPVEVLNHFAYTTLATISLPDPETVTIQINVYRYSTSGNILNEGEPFFTLTQELKQY